MYNIFENWKSANYLCTNKKIDIENTSLKQSIGPEFIITRSGAQSLGTLCMKILFTYSITIFKENVEFSVF